VHFAALIVGFSIGCCPRWQKQKGKTREPHYDRELEREWEDE
jgi:hypothetical protein